MTESEGNSLVEVLHAARRAIHAVPPTELVKELAVLFTAFPDPRVDGGNAEAKRRRDKLYFDVIERKPLAAVSAAVMRLVKGQVPWARPSFLPTPAELSRVVEEEVAVIAAEGIRIKRILDGRIDIEKEPQEVRDLAATRAGKIVADWKREVDSREKSIKAAAREQLESSDARLLERERAMHPGTPPGISPELHNLLKRYHPAD